ncbi:M18BP protein, partial [Semnornis frantzii]|nr:M18BP protein [Semnornis frantzii]
SHGISTFQFQLPFLKAVCCFSSCSLRDKKGQLWHSNTVMERIKSNQVRTSSGSVYLLQGRIDGASMRKEGFPYKFIKRFMFGFSKKWKEYVEEFLEERRR